MLSRTDRILAVFERKLAALNLDKKAADDAGPEEEKIAEDLFRIMQKLDGTKPEKREEHPSSPMDDFELIGRDWKEKAALHQDAIESISDMVKFKISREKFYKELERSKLEEELEGLIEEEEYILEDIELIREQQKDFSDEWDELKEDEKEQLEELDQIRDERKLCEAKLALVRKTMHAWDDEGRFNHDGKDAQQSQPPSKVHPEKLPSQREPNLPTKMHSASQTPDSSARYPPMLSAPGFYAPDLPPPISSLYPPVGGISHRRYPMTTSSTSKLPDMFAPGSASKESACNFPPSSSLSENLERASEASDTTYADSERFLAKRPSYAQQQEQLPRLSPFPAAELPTRPRGLPYMGGHYPQAAFQPSLSSVSGRQYQPEFTPHYPNNGSSWLPGGPLGTYTGSEPVIGSHLLTPPNRSAHFQHLPRAAQSCYPSYNGVGNFWDPAQRWY